MAAIALALVGCAHSGADSRRAAQQLGSASWQELRSERFILVTDGSTAALESFATDLARFIAVVDAVLSLPPAKGPVRIFLLSDMSQPAFIDSDDTQGIFFPFPAGSHSFVRASEHSPIRRETLLHEFTHYLTRPHDFPSYPFWHQEGMAEFLGSTRARGDTMELGAAPPGRVEELNRQRAPHQKFAIAHILGYDPSSGDKFSSLDYARSWALVHYLHTSPERSAQLAKLLRLQLAGHPWQEAFAATFTESPAQLAEEVDAHVDRLSRGAPDSLIYLDLDALHVDLRWTIRDLGRSEAEVTLGEVAMLHENHGLAEALFRDAIDLSPDDMRARTALIAALAAQGRFDSAREMSARIDVAALTEPESLDHLGYAFYAEGDSMKPSDGETSNAEQDARFAKALACFERASRLDPRSPVAWAGLARSRFATGDRKGALEALEEASKTGEVDGELMRDWDRAMRQEGRDRAP